MTERAGGPDRGIGRLGSALRRKVDSTRERFKVVITPKDELRRAALAEAREQALLDPTYQVLKINFDYQKWRDDGKMPSSAFDTQNFELIRDNVPVNPYSIEAVWLEKVIDPDLDEETLKERSTAYCLETASRFIETATGTSGELASDEEDPTPERLKHAIALLIGTSSFYEDTTIFKDQSWRTANYVPDYKRLEVDLEEAGISEEKVMAGVGLCIGLWVRLADADATRPVSGAKFGPPFEHCSFLDLVTNSGWAEYTNPEGDFHDAVMEGFHDQGLGARENFFSQFRDSDFFQNTHAILTKPE